VLTDVLAYLRCPVCVAALRPHGQVVRCPRGHSFDVARQGYVHLARGRLTHPGDSADMVAARAALLSSGVFDFVGAALADAVPDPHGLVVDAGAGTGHYLATVLDAWPQTVGLAVDVSKPAVRRAARSHSRAGAVLADSWRGLPVADGVAAVLLNVFAPRNGPEFARVLRVDGRLLVVTPTGDHLADLTGRLGLLRVDPDKPARVAASLTRWFRLIEESVHERRLRLTRDQVRALIGMGPSARHASRAQLDRALAASAEPVLVTASIRLASYARMPPVESDRSQVDRSISSQPRGGS
jgi:23S rRNA (guanine745-N1)-methyltransferase